MPNAILSSDVTEGEGPVLLDGSLFCVEMAASRACVTRIDLQTRSHESFKLGGRPNGMTVDGNGRLWVAEARAGAVVCLTPDGRELLRIAGDQEGRFLWPNDLRFGPDGHLYLTDSGIIDVDFMRGLEIRPDWATAPYDGRVYEIDPVEGRVVRTIDRGLKFTNGLAFDKDGVLFVAETLTGEIFFYDVLGSPRPRRQRLGNTVLDHGTGQWRGPDGIAFAADGRLYCTVYGQSNLIALDADGRMVDSIATDGAKPTNLAFDLERPIAYVTEVSLSSVEIVDMPSVGQPLHAPYFDVDRKLIQNHSDKRT